MRRVQRDGKPPYLRGSFSSGLIPLGGASFQRSGSGSSSPSEASCGDASSASCSKSTPFSPISSSSSSNDYSSAPPLPYVPLRLLEEARLLRDCRETLRPPLCFDLTDL